MKDYSISSIVEESERNPNPDFEGYVVARDTYNEAIFGVVSFSKDWGKDYGGMYVCQRVNHHTTIPGNNVKRYADTIDELIQRIIVKFKNHYIIYSKYKFGKLTTKELKEMMDSGREILGCIWTGIGLRYVAKMNKDLEWELETFFE